MESLALKYRPQRFADLVGQRAVQIILKQMVATGTVPHALLLQGSRGTGKTTTARILAAALNCTESATNAPCGTCPSCKGVFDGSSMDLVEIDAASNGGVDDMRNLRQQVLYRGGAGAYRVVVLDEAHSISPAGFNALLKTLEEPPPQTIFLLLTTETHKIPDTVVSRCMSFDFRRLCVADIVARLSYVAQQQGITVEEPLLRLLAEEADGAMRDALMRLEQIAAVNLSTVEQYQRLIGHVDYCPAILSALTRGDLLTALNQVDEALTRVPDPDEILTGLLATLRDVLVLRLGGEVAKSGVALAERQNLALALEQPVVMAAMKVFWQVMTQCKIRDSRQVLDMALTLLSEVFGQTRTPNTPARMTFSQIARMA